MPFSSIISPVTQCWIVCVLCSSVLAIVSIKNFCFEAIFSIVASVYSKNKKITNTSEVCPFLFINSFWERKELPFYLPDYFYEGEVTMNLANTVFYVGKVFMLVPAGILSDIGYSKYILCAGMVMMAVGFFLFAVFAKSAGLNVFLLQNFIEGVGEAFIFPSIFTLISHWAPNFKRNLLTAVVVSGTFFGHGLGYFFLRYTYLGYRSLRAGYFISGLINLLWLALGSVFIYHSPNDSPFTRQSISSTSAHRMRKPILIKLREIPWRSIATSPPFLSLVSVYCSVDWAADMTIWLSFSNYELYRLHLPVIFSAKSGIMISISTVPATLIAGFFSDWLIEHSVISNTFVKKTCTFTTVYIASILQVTAVLVGCNIMAFWVLSITAVYVIGLANPVIYSSPMDLCSRHAGVLSGIVYTVRALCDILDDFVDSVLVNVFNPGHWRNKIIAHSLISVVLVIPFLLFGSGEPQRWTRQNRVTIREEPAAELQLSETELAPTSAEK